MIDHRMSTATSTLSTVYPLGTRVNDRGQLERVVVRRETYEDLAGHDFL